MRFLDHTIESHCILWGMDIDCDLSSAIETCILDPQSIKYWFLYIRIHLQFKNPGFLEIIGVSDLSENEIQDFVSNHPKFTKLCLNVYYTARSFFSVMRESKQGFLSNSLWGNLQTQWHQI